MGCRSYCVFLSISVSLRKKYAAMNQLLSMDQVFLNKLTAIIESNLHNEKFGPAEVSRSIGMSRSGIHRKLISLTKQSLSQFIQEKRLQKAMEMLLHNVATASEVSFMVGFSSPAYFNKCFHDYYGYPPGEVKKVVAHEREHTGDRLVSDPDATQYEPVTVLKKRNSQKQWYIRILLIVMSVTLILFAILYFQDKPLFNQSAEAKYKEKENQDRSIVVLPFKNLDNNPDNLYFTDAVWIDILNRLSNIRDLRVISRTTAEYFRGSKLTAGEIGNKINVNHILEADVRRYGGNVWIAVQLVDIRNDRIKWSNQYDLQLADIFSIQTTIARKIAEELQMVLSEQETKQIEKIPTHNQEAYELYILGRYFVDRRTKEGTDKGIAYLTRSIEADPYYAQAYALLAYAYFTCSWEKYHPLTIGYEKARASALRALKIDKNQAEAMTILAELYFLDWKWEKARKEYMHAIECNPNDAMVRRYYMDFLNMLGELEEARRQIDLARKIDPLSSIVLWQSAALYFYTGEYEKALEELRTLQDVDSSFYLTYVLFWRIYMIQGDESRTLDAIQMAYQNGSSQFQEYADSVKNIYRQSGMDGVIRNFFKHEKRPYFLALHYAQLNEKEKALEYLEKACEMNDIQGPIYFEPAFKNIRSDPRFLQIIKKMGLSPYLEKYFNN